MKPLGHYGLKLDPDTEKAIANFDLSNLCGLNSITADLVSDEFIDDRYKGIHARIRLECDKLTPRQKISLIRALCDRIELKLMEQAN
jgi:hypothetical protein